MNEHDAVRVRPAATVILVRDAPDLEVLMLRRRDESLFAAGAWVFPGGAVDDSDRAAAEGAATPGVVGRDDREASERLGLDRGGLAYWMAAMRECFEEAGLLPARTVRGAPAAPEWVERLGRRRPDVESGRVDFAALVHGAGLRLDLGEICYFGHWITPVGPPRRYDTRFFVTAAPRGQDASPDGDETTEASWTRPALALAAHDDGDIDLILPTMRSLEVLSRFDTAAEVMAAARVHDSRGAPTDVVGDRGGWRIRLPGDAGDRISAASHAGGDDA